jgi:hypothetical protein
MDKLKGVNSKTTVYPVHPQKESVQQEYHILENSSSNNTAEDHKNIQEEKIHNNTEEKNINYSKDIVIDISQWEKEQQNRNTSKGPHVVSDTQKVRLPSIRILRRGDYISKLAVEIYGTASDEVLELIKKHNPQIKDINKVTEGEKVLFPSLPPRHNG